MLNILVKTLVLLNAAAFVSVQWARVLSGAIYSSTRAIVTDVIAGIFYIS